ncbi:bacteriohemerythrin [Bacteroidota bacterium]
MEPQKNINWKWKDSYSFGIPIIDFEHKKFIGIYDKVANLIINKEQISDTEIIDVINEMINYLKVHLKTEENLIKQAGYPDFDGHIKQHKFFIEKIDEFNISFSYKNKLLINNLFVFIKKWFLLHIIQTDAKYVDCVKLYLKENPV